ncbi:MAG: hypothetical protein KF819_39690 [Labilithrix sp.]|nr:hypothetical protein [Labilithrix sp.]
MFLDDRGSVGAFERLFGAALIANAGSEIYAGVWHVHTGRFYPWRHLGILPLHPPAILALEWALTIGCGLLLALRKRTTLAWRIATPLLLFSVLQRFSNHGALLFIVALFVSLSPPSDSSREPNLGLVRAQLVIVYVFSALNKLTHGFTRGTSLHVLLGLGAPLAPAASWAVVAVELVIPIALVMRPRAGLALVIAMHLAFAALIPGVASFGLVMTAMATLFLDVTPRRERG